MVSRFYREEDAPEGSDPLDVLDPDAVEVLLGLGFRELGSEITLPERSGDPNLFTGEDREFHASLQDRGTRSVVYGSPDGFTAVSPELGFGVPLANFHTLLATGDVVVTRVAPDQLPDLAVSEGTVLEDGTELAPTSPAAMRWMAAIVGLHDTAIFPDLPGRGLHRSRREAGHEQVWALHQQRVAQVARELGTQPVPMDLDTYLATLRRAAHVGEQHAAEQAVYQDRLAEAAAGVLTALLGLGAVQWGLAPGWVAACLIGVPLGLWSQQFARHWVLWWVGLLAPVWLLIAAKASGMPRADYQAVAVLGAGVLTAWFAREAWGLLLVYRIFPQVSARAPRPPRVPVDRFLDRYSE